MIKTVKIIVINTVLMTVLEVLNSFIYELHITAAFE